MDLALNLLNLLFVYSQTFICCVFDECMLCVLSMFFLNCKTFCNRLLCAPLEKRHEILPIIIMTQNLDLCMVMLRLGYGDVAVWVSKG